MSTSPFVNRQRDIVVSASQSSSPFPEIETREDEGMGETRDLSSTMRELFSMRKTTQSPYKGYYKDGMALMEQQGAPLPYPAENREDVALTSSINADEIEYRALIRRRDFREKLATKVLRRMNEARGERAFHAWKGHVFRYVVVRNQMVKCFRQRNASLCFHAWRASAHREAILRRVMKRYWKKHRMMRFKWWKLLARWKSLKVGLLRTTFRALAMHSRRKQIIYRKFAHVSMKMRRHHSANVIQCACAAYQHRKIYWAHKKVHLFIYKRWEQHIWRNRVMEEKVRMRDEEVVYRAIVERAKKFLHDKLQEDEGIELLRTYLFEVENALRREAKSGEQVFPSKAEEPQLARLFTTRSKAMYILNKRGELDVLRLSREKFRRSAPPRYYCTDCMSVFLTGSASRLHRRLGCPHEGGIHHCKSWVLARDITELALERLLVNFFRKPRRPPAHR